MSKQYPGGILSKTPVTPSGPYINSTASGIWTLEDQVYWQKLGQWPNPANPAPDAQFNYVTMLLQGDGTNGAQNNTFLDSSTNNFTITRNGNTTQGSFSPYGSYWGGYFDPATTGISIVVDDSLSTNPYRLACSGTNYTIEFWVFRRPRVATYQCMHSASGDANNFIIDSSDNLGVTSNGGTTMFTVAANTYIPVNTWTYVTLVCENTTWSLYFNGTLYGTYSGASKTYGGGGSGGIQTGGRNDMNGCGYMSNFRVSSVARYSGSAFTVPTAPLAADGNTALFLCSLNRFIDASQYNSTYTITFNSTPSIQRFNSFGAGSTAYSTSVIGGSGYFDGTTDYLTTPMSTPLTLGAGDFTIECWLYGTFVGEQRPLSCLESTLNYYIYAIYLSGTELRFYAGDGTSYAIQMTAAGAMKPSAWNHVAVVRSGSTATMYVNGVSVATDASASVTLPAAGTALWFGGEAYGGGYNFFNGYMTDARIVKGTAVYTAAFTPPTAPLTAITNTSILLNYTNGAIFDNAMQNDLETVGNAQISTSVKKFGTGSLAFDGTGDYLIGAPNLTGVFNTGNFTIEAWVYTTASSGTQCVFDTRYTDSSTAGCFFGLYSSNALLFYTSASVLTGGTLSTNTWYHIAAVRSGTTVTLYLNGTSVASGTRSNSFTQNNVLIGSSPGVTGSTINAFFGYIDGLRVTNGYARYTSNFSVPTAAFPNTGPY
jgi:hypothetical protein